MAESAADRVRAAKLRQAPRRTPQQQRWLDEYTARTALAKARASAPAPAAVQSTTAPSSSSDPSAFMWTPTVPANEDAPPIAAGAMPPPEPGTPLVDGTPVQADPAAAAMIVTIVTVITTAGLAAALELITTTALPPAVLTFVGPLLHIVVGGENPEEAGKKQAAIIGEVAAAAQRLANKWGVKALPYQDELVVAGACAGSVLAVGAVMKRRALAKPARPGANGKASPPPKEDTPPASSPEPSPFRPPVPGLWS